MFIQNRDTREPNLTPLQYTGLLIIIVGCGFPGVAMNGFLGGLNIPLVLALMIATIAGLIGGALMCHEPVIAGIVGGLIAGPLGLLAVYFYTSARQEVWSVELALVQGVASLPGWGIGYLLKRLLKPTSDEPVAAELCDDPARHDQPTSNFGGSGGQWSFTNLPESRPPYGPR